MNGPMYLAYRPDGGLICKPSNSEHSVRTAASLYLTTHQEETVKIYTVWDGPPKLFVEVARREYGFSQKIKAMGAKA